MNALKDSSMYLSGPIEAEDADTPDWRSPVIKELVDRFGINVYNPAADEKQIKVNELHHATESHNFDEVEKIASGFVKKDLGKIDRCDFLVAYNPLGIPSVGTPCEVHHAVQLKKPVFIVCPEGKKFASKWYFGYIRHRYIFGSWDDFYAYLKEVDEYKHKDNHRWHFVYKMV